MNDHWTAEEYRTFLETGKEPVRAPAARHIPDENVPETFKAYMERVRDHYAEVEADADRRRQEIAQAIADAEKAAHPARKRKYRNEPTYVDGIRFDSKHEACVYQALMLHVKNGIFKCVCRQVKFDLPGGIRYIADFVAIAPDNTIRVMDAKSAITRKNRVYINKKKQMLAVWGIEIEEV